MGRNWGVPHVVIGISWLETVEVGKIHPYLGLSFSNVLSSSQTPDSHLWETNFSCTQTSWVMITHGLTLTDLQDGS